MLDLVDQLLDNQLLVNQIFENRTRRFMLDNLQKIRIERPVDQIIDQIRTLISSGELKPGDKLPPERKLAEHFGVGRGQVRDAIQKLEFYGILKTRPQSGTVVAGIGLTAIEGLITDVLRLEPSDFASLVETRVILEVNAAKLAAERRSTDCIIKLKKALADYEQKIEEGKAAVEEDLLFHLKIAESSGNGALKSLMMIITPDIVKSFIDLNVCSADRFKKTVQEHREILNYIIDQNAEAAGEAMRKHLMDVSEFSRTIDTNYFKISSTKI